MKKKLLREPVYGSAVLYLAGDDEACRRAAAEWFDSLDMAHNADKPIDGRAGTFSGERMHYAIWVRDPAHIPSLVHEAIHVGVDLLGEIGLPINTQTDEALAYYCDWIVGAALKAL